MTTTKTSGERHVTADRESLLSAGTLAAVERAAKARSNLFRQESGFCLQEARNARRQQHIERHDALASLAARLRKDGHATDDEAMILYHQAQTEWDDAIHVASLEDPLRSLCGQYGRNLDDLPSIPDGGSGCWTCIGVALELIPATGEEVLAREAANV